jgi:hypothetical protein
MKIVINTKIGGFDISAEALYELISQNSEFISSYEQTPKCGYEQWIGFKNGYEKEVATDRLKKDNVVFFHHDDYRESRTDSKLIQILLNLGKNANTKYSELKIVEIPDDVKWYIRCYDDGTEEIHEEHRVWS